MLHGCEGKGLDENGGKGERKKEEKRTIMDGMGMRELGRCVKWSQGKIKERGRNEKKEKMDKKGEREEKL